MKRTVNNQGPGLKNLFPVNLVHLSFTMMSMAIVSALFFGIMLILPAGLSHARDAATVLHSAPASFPAAALKTIIVGNYYPYTFVNDNGIPDGFSVEIAKACARVMDRKLEIKVDTWENATKALTNGTIDLLPMMAASPERDKSFDFSVPHTIAYDAVFLRSGSQKIRSLNDLVGKTVIVMNKDAAHDYLLSSGMAARMNLVLIDSLPDALRALAAGKGDAALMPKLVGLLVIKKLNLTNLDPSPTVIEGYNRPFCFAVKDGNQALLERLSQGLSIIKSTGQYQEIYKKWFGTVEPPGLSRKTIIKYIALSAAVFLIIALGLILWTLSLRKQVALRTEKLATEIQDRKRAEEALQESNDKFLILASNIPAYIAYVNADTLQYEFVNDAFEKSFGMPREKIIGSHIKEVIGEANYQFALHYINEAKSGKSISYENAFDLASGKRWIEVNYTPVIDAHGHVASIAVLSYDITQRKRMEEALQESEEKYRLLFESAGEGITIAQGEKIHFANEAMVKILGYPLDVITTRPFLSFVHPEDRAMVLDRYLRRMKGEVAETDYPFRIINADGSEKWFHINSKVIDWEGTPASLSFMIDITERKRVEEEKQNLEERLQRAEKMEALGTMAGGVAHDLNNVLGIVVGYAEMLLDDVDKSSPLRPGLVNIMDGGQRAAAIIQDLLTLARRGVSGRRVLNLNKIIDDCRQSPEFENLYSRHSTVRIKTDLEPDLLNISGSSVHLGKTLYNLIANASEAMAEGGSITIRTANQYLDTPIHGYDEIREGDYVVLAVSDTGEGIPEDNLRRIFEPFYTKKIMGRSGTGLGLAVVWGTVKDHNGYINVESQEGKGSTFTLYFPVTREDTTAEAVPLSISEYMGRGESILVVDDVKGQRDLATGMLRRLNYSVTSVSSGEEAIAYLKDHTVDLMVLDMIMDPGMDGLDTYRNILEIVPKQKAIIVSGFSESDRVQAAQALGAGAYVKKPYVMEKLGVAVREELDIK